MVKTIAVFTGTRAEYGLLNPLMAALRDDATIELKLIVTGTHLSPEFGLTWKEVFDDGFAIDEKIEILLSSDSAIGVAKSMGLGVLGFADALARINPDCIIILGDRFEALAMAQTAMIMRVPVVHLHGGEITEGAYDDAIRHAITKMSQLHFTSTAEHRKRVIQLGEDPNTVFNVGAIGLDHIKNSQLMSLEELSLSLDFNLNRPYFLVTYHPVTLADEDPETTFNTLIDVLDSYTDLQVIVTYPNADDGGRRIIPLIEKWAQQQPERVKAIPSLGFRRYLSAVKNAVAVVGNSSSGIIEVPSLQVASVDIGHRRQGRTAAESVIRCGSTCAEISKAVDQAIKLTIKLKAAPIENPYGSGDTAKKIMTLIKEFSPIAVKKFYDLP